MKRFILVIGLVAAAAVPASSAPPQASADARPHVSPPCQRPGVTLARPIKPRPEKLGELPAGNVVLTVVREVGGCHTPVIVRYGTGRL
jgi:hypothetical protein